MPGVSRALSQPRALATFSINSTQNVLGLVVCPHVDRMSLKYHHTSSPEPFPLNGHGPAQLPLAASHALQPDICCTCILKTM